MIALTRQEIFAASVKTLTTPLDHDRVLDTLALLYYETEGTNYAPTIVFLGSPLELLDTAGKYMYRKSWGVSITGGVQTVLMNTNFTGNRPPSSLLSEPVRALGLLLSQNYGEKRTRSHLEPHERFYITTYSGAYFVNLLVQLGVRKLNVPQNAELIRRCAEDLHFFIPFNDVCFISERPTKLLFNEELELSCEDGASVTYPNTDHNIYSLDGIRLNRQVVESPSTLSLDFINSINSAEAKRLTINRFGWSRYLAEMKAQILDINFPYEALVKSERYTVLCTYDPSTGRFYALEVDRHCRTCEEAQRYLLSPHLALQGLNNSSQSIATYPKLRT